MLIPTRKLGKLLRGGASRLQIVTATLLGSLIGFSPGFSQSPGWNALLIALLVLLNLNLFVAGFSLLISTPLYLLLRPVLFRSGIFLLEGPLAGLFAFFANAPVSAWFGIEYYVMPAGVLVGSLFGIGLGLFLFSKLHAFHEKMAHLQKDSARYAAFTARKPIKILAWILLGGLEGKKSWEELAAQSRRAPPIRLLGALLVALVAFLLTVTFIFLDELVLTQVARSTLERANGATVDLERLEFVPTESRLALHGLAMADPNALETDLFRAERLVAEVDGMNLLAKKVALRRVEAINASTGEKRRLPGQRIAPDRDAPRLPPFELPESVSLEEVLAQAKIWRERLQRISEVLERVGGSPDPEEPVDDEALSWRETLELRAQERGYAHVSSDSIIRQAPRLRVDELLTEGMRVAQLPDERLRIIGRNLSTHPRLLTASPSLIVEAQSGRFGVDLEGGSLAAERSKNHLNAFLNALPVDLVASMLSDPSKFPFSGGTFDLRTEGSWIGASVDLPIDITAKDTKVTLLGQSSSLSSTTFPIRVVGPLGSPAIQIPSDALQSALRGAVGGRLREELGRQLDRKLGSDDEEKTGGSLFDRLPFPRNDTKETEGDASKP